MSIRAFQSALVSQQTPLFSALRKLRNAESVNLSTDSDWPRWDGTTSPPTAH